MSMWNAQYRNESLGRSVICSIDHMYCHTINGCRIYPYIDNNHEKGVNYNKNLKSLLMFDKWNHTDNLYLRRVIK
jgi:hypothetical protein